MNKPLPSHLDSISQRLVSARARAEALSNFPGDIPATLGDAYSVQSASIARWQDAVAGWKVGMVPQEYRERLAAERLSGPVFRSLMDHVEPGETRTMAIYAGGFAAVEAEFVFRIAQTIEPDDREYSDADLISLVSGLHVGIEIASSPMADVNRLGPCCVVSDFGNNAGLLVGPDVPDWHTLSPDTLRVAVSVDGEVVGEAGSDAIEGGLLQALRFLVDLSAKRSLTLTPGTYVSCGAVTGIHEVTAQSRSVVDFGAFGQFFVEFTPMLPMPARLAQADS